MSDARLVIHGHFYQPPRENPWTEEVAAEPSAAPFHDWNERITAEAYRPNGWARVVDDRGRITDIVDNYAHLSFNIGPTLLSWLERHQPRVYERVLEADRAGGGAIAQAYNHMILPLADERDVRTQVRWGLADFAHRFGRPAPGVWLPETAVNDDVLRVLVEEGVGFTILAPGQAVATRPLDADSSWTDVSDGSIQVGQPHRWFHPDAPAREAAGQRGHIDLVFYDGPISHDLAFGLTGLSSQDLLRRVQDAAVQGNPVVVATDGETFGHHHKFAERALAYAFSHEAAATGVRVMHTAALVEEVPPTHEVRVRESAWSCVHGVQRWAEDCGCSTGGEPGWNQAWRAPLRHALDVLRDHAAEVFERRGSALLRDVWVARDAWINVVLGLRSIDDLLADHLLDDVDDEGGITALTLLEVQRQSLLMYTSCGWFFNDLAGIETLQIMRYAARLLDLLDEIGEADAVRDRFLDRLAEARSNIADEGDGRAIWHRHVEPSRVDAGRVVAHLALVTLLEGRTPSTSIAGYDVVDHPHRQVSRGALSGVAGHIVLCHQRTRRMHEQVYAAVHLGGLEVFGATRPADAGRDADLFEQLAEAVARGERVTTLLRLIVDGFGPREFGLDSALPDAADQIVAGAADTLAERFAETYDRLYADHRSRLDALITAGYPLPPELRAPMELALARRFEVEIARAVHEDGAERFTVANDIAREARRAGVQLATPRAARTMSATLLAAVERAVEQPDDDERAGAALGLLRLVRGLDLPLDLERPQELVFEAMRGDGGASLRTLGAALGLGV
jgi:alpha-amylase/alpha-mannosidase (GH57 family)